MIRALLGNYPGTHDLRADRFDEIDRIESITLEEGHVDGVPCPPPVRCDAFGTDLIAMLTAGAVDAVIVDPVPEDSRFVRVVPDADANRRNLDVAIPVAEAQHLLATPLTVDDLVTDVLASLNA